MTAEAENQSEKVGSKKEAELTTVNGSTQSSDTGSQSESQSSSSQELKTKSVLIPSYIRSNTTWRHRSRSHRR